MVQIEAKYFSAADQESAVAAAEEYFHTTHENLFFEVMPSAITGITIVLSINPGAQGLDAVTNMDGFFTLDYNSDGVALNLFRAHGAGTPVLAEKISQYIERKHLQGLDPDKAKQIIEQGWGSNIIAAPQQEIILDEDVQVSTDDKNLEAYIRFLPADPGGAALTKEVLLQRLQENGIIHGLIDAAVDKFLQEKTPAKRYLIAAASMPMHGKPGKLIFHFDLEKSGKPKIDENERVDYRALDLFENVQQDQLLVTRKLATTGIPGMTVLGAELKPTPGKDVKLPRGKNIVVNDAMTEIRAAVSGMVVYVNGNVTVSNVYTLKGNADMTTGNIDFDGSVIIQGNVIAGMVIKASGNIEIGGVVESATIIAGGNIVLKRGIQGMDKGNLTAEGNITAGYIERARVIAGGSVIANTIAHSSIEAGDSLLLQGKNASIVGGSAMASNSITAKAIGSIAETTMDAGVGILPQKRARIHFLREEEKRLGNEIEKLSTIDAYLKKLPELDEKKQEMKLSVDTSLKHNRELRQAYIEEMAQLDEEFQNAVHGKIHVSDAAYPGVRITIASASYKVTQITPNCTFRLNSEGEVTFGPYEG